MFRVGPACIIHVLWLPRDSKRASQMKALPQTVCSRGPMLGQLQNPFHIGNLSLVSHPDCQHPLRLRRKYGPKELGI